MLVNEWVVDPDWRAALTTDVLLFDDVAGFLRRTIDRLGGAAAASLVEDCLNDARAAAESHRERLNQQLGAVEGWRGARHAYAYYAIGEAITEASAFSEGIIEQLADTFGERYLAVLAEVDRLYPSQSSARASAHAYAHTLGADASPAVAIYLVLKRWQDDQHEYHEEILFPQFRAARRRFEEWVANSAPHLSGLSAKEALATIDVLEALSPVAVDELSALRISGAVTDSMVSSIFGGKALGLVRLKEVGARIPRTYCYSICDQTTLVPQDLLRASKQFAVRSSATVEDGPSNAFAGMFKSFLRVPAEELDHAFQGVRGSVSSPRVNEYVDAFSTQPPRMGVLVQEFEEPSQSGVWIGSNRGGGVLEWTNGDGEALVQGLVTPVSETWPPSTNELLRDASGVPVGQQALELQRRLQTASADFEFCVVGGTVLWLQYREATQEVPPEAYSVPSSNASRNLAGRAASSGRADGLAVWQDEPDAEAFPQNSVLVCDVTSPDWIGVMRRAVAIVTADGGVLSHAAITARELGKPCVVGVGRDARLLHESRVQVDGDAGRVTLLEGEESSGESA